MRGAGVPRTLPRLLPLLVVVATIATADELLQGQVPQRHMDPFDGLADLVGATIALVLCRILPSDGEGRS